MYFTILVYLLRTIQPTLTDYLEYRGDIFELFERTNQLTGPKTDREQEVKDKHIEWYDVDYLKRTSWNYSSFKIYI